MAALFLLFLLPFALANDRATMNSFSHLTTTNPPKFFNIGVMFAIAINDQPSPYLDYFGAM
jgi:hypothetical protein